MAYSSSPPWPIKLAIVEVLHHATPTFLPWVMGTTLAMASLPKFHYQRWVESLAPYCVKDDDKNGQFSFSIMHGIYFATQPMMEDLSTKV
jgi:hypothetical protein